MTAAALVCGSCGTELSPNSKFCNECGAAVATATTPAEYKQVTVLFADVVHSMDIAAAVGAERLREIMTDLADRCAAVVQRYGGTVDKFTGDGIMAIFGAPVALEDHAVRACLAALGVQEETRRLAVDVHDRDGVELRLRVGLNSGQVIAGEIGSGPFGYRQGVENLWVSRSGQRTKLYGKGKQYRARYTDTNGGKEHTRRFKYKADASEWLKQITRSGVDIATPVTGEWTVAQQFSQWIRKADIARTTRATRQHTWRAHVSDKWGDLQVTKVAPPDVKAWVADLVDVGTGVPTIENALGVLRMVLKDAVDDGRLVRNPCDGINAPRRQYKSRAYLTHQQVEQLAYAAGEGDGLVVRLLAYTRPSVG